MMNPIESELVVGASLQKLGITGPALIESSHGNAIFPSCLLTPIATVTNEVVLDLHQFLYRYPSCTYQNFTFWLRCLFGESWPIHQPPTVKAITQSVKRLLAKRDKLKKQQCSCSGKDQMMLDFMNEEYALPVIFRVKGGLHKSSAHQQQTDSVQSEDLSSCEDSSEFETLKAVNKDLCNQIAKCTCYDSYDLLRKKMYSLHRNTNKKLGRRDNAISEQSKRIDKQKSDLEKLHKKVYQMESQLHQLRTDKDRLRHRVDYWKSKSYHLKSSSEEQDVQEIADKQSQIDALKENLPSLEEHNIVLRDQLEEASSSSENNEIETFRKGCFSDDIRSCCYKLLLLNVGIRNIDPVIRTVLNLVAHKSVSRLPSHTVLGRMIIEGSSVAEMQLGREASGRGKR